MKYAKLGNTGIQVSRWIFIKFFDAVSCVKNPI